MDSASPGSCDGAYTEPLQPRWTLTLHPGAASVVHNMCALHCFLMRISISDAALGDHSHAPRPQSSGFLLPSLPRKCWTGAIAFATLHLFQFTKCFFHLSDILYRVSSISFRSALLVCLLQDPVNENQANLEQEMNYRDVGNSCSWKYWFKTRKRAEIMLKELPMIT